MRREMITLCGAAAILAGGAASAQDDPRPVRCADAYSGTLGTRAEVAEEGSSYPRDGTENIHVLVDMSEAEIEASVPTGHQTATRLCAMRVAFEAETVGAGHTIVFDQEGRVVSVSERQDFQAMGETYASYVLGRE